MAKHLESQRELETTGQVMTALGGDQAVSELTGVPSKHVNPWNRVATFPSKYFFVMDWALRKKRFRASPELWGQILPKGWEKTAA